MISPGQSDTEEGEEGEESSGQNSGPGGPGGARPGRSAVAGEFRARREQEERVRNSVWGVREGGDAALPWWRQSRMRRSDELWDQVVTNTHYMLSQHQGVVNQRAVNRRHLAWRQSQWEAGHGERGDSDHLGSDEPAHDHSGPGQGTHQEEEGEGHTRIVRVEEILSEEAQEDVAQEDVEREGVEREDVEQKASQRATGLPHEQRLPFYRAFGGLAMSSRPYAQSMSIRERQEVANRQHIINLAHWERGRNEQLMERLRKQEDLLAAQESLVGRVLQLEESGRACPGLQGIRWRQWTGENIQEKVENSISPPTASRRRRDRPANQIQADLGLNGSVIGSASVPKTSD